MGVNRGHACNQPELYSTTLQLQLEINTIGKLLAHNAALYRPTLRQLGHTTVTANVVCGFHIDDAMWLRHCRFLVDDSGKQLGANLMKAVLGSV